MKYKFDSGPFGEDKIVLILTQRHHMERSTGKEEKKLEKSTLPGITFNLFTSCILDTSKGLYFLPLSFEATTRIGICIKRDK